MTYYQYTFFDEEPVEVPDDSPYEKHLEPPKEVTQYGLDD